MTRSPITLIHWCVLLLACALMFGNYYCYDIPAALNVPLQKWLGSDYHYYQSQINLLYSAYSLPNIILPLIGGVLVDSLSPSTMLIVFSIFVCSGQALFSFGVQERYFPVMLAGRFLFGLGGESLEVAQASMTTLWFQGRGLAFALGMNLAFARIATAFNDNLSPYLAGIYGTPMAVWSGFIVCILSFIGGITLIFLNRPEIRCRSGVFLSDQEEEQFQMRKRSFSQDEEDIADETTALLADVDVNSQMATPNPDSGIEIRIDSDSSRPTKDINPDNISIESDQTSEEYDEEDETIHFGQIWKFSRSFWLLFMTTILTYGSVVPFFHVCTDFFQQKWYHNDPQTAGMVMSLPDIISAIGSPICGLLVDRFGHRSTLMPFSSVLIVITHALLTFTSLSPMISMSILGVSYSMFASALWPCVPFLVGRHQIATAYGLMTVALNVSLFTFPLVVAEIRKRAAEDDFLGMELFFLALSGLATISSLALLYDDIKRGDRKLMKPAFGTIKDQLHEQHEGEEDAQNDLEETEEVPEDEWTAKVIGEGIVIPAPITLIHHRHHHSSRLPPVSLERQLSASWDPTLTIHPSIRASENSNHNANTLRVNTSLGTQAASHITAGPSSPISPSSVYGLSTEPSHRNIQHSQTSSSQKHYHTTFCRCYEDDRGQSRRKTRRRLNSKQHPPSHTQTIRSHSSTRNPKILASHAPSSSRD